MIGFNSIDEKDSNNLSVTDFLESLDTDMNLPVNLDVLQDENSNNSEPISEDIESDSEEITALVEVKPHSLLAPQTIFKKSIKISIKSFLISLSLGFLNLFF